MTSLLPGNYKEKKTPVRFFIKICFYIYLPTVRAAHNNYRALRCNEHCHLQNIWFPCVKVLSQLFFIRLIKRGKWYADVPKYIIFEGSAKRPSRTILIYSCDHDACNFHWMLRRRKCLSMLFQLIVCRLLLAQCIFLVIGRISLLCHAIEAKFSPMLAIKHTRQCGISDQRANAVILVLGKRFTFISS